MKTVSIGIDLGGTKIIAGLVSRKGKINNRIEIPTRAKDGRKAVVRRLVLAAEKVIEKSGVPKNRIEGIGIGSPGLIDHSRGIVNVPPNLPGWKKVLLAKEIKKALGLPVYVINDANAAALAESVYGAGRKYGSILCITLGTGVGGGIVVNRRLYLGHKQRAGEIGHMVVEKDGYRCKCGGRGCLERYVGNEYIVERAIRKIKQGQKSKLIKMTGGRLNEITPLLLSKAARQGDTLSKQVWEETGRYIGIVLASVMNFMDPGVIVIGGGVARAGQLIFTPIRRTVRQYAYALLHENINRRIVPAELGNNAGAVGAATFVWHQRCRGK